jgi:hypothetical protein
MKYEIYKMTNIVTNKVYIGYTKMGIENRIHKHYLNAISGLETKLYFSIRKHGIHNFKYKCIDESDSFNEIKNKEIYWIEKYDTLKNGYNMTKGGDGGDIINQLTPDKYDVFISKMSEINGGVNNPKYSGYSDEEIINYAIECYIENNHNWIQQKWYDNYCEKLNIPKTFSKFRFNGKGMREMKRLMVLKLNEMGYEVDEIKYKVTKEHKNKLSELNKNKSWYHNDILMKNKQLNLSELTEEWERGRKKYN